MKKPNLGFTNGTETASTGVANAQTVNTVQHVLGVIEKTATGFQTHLYQDGSLTKSGTDTAMAGYGPIAGAGLNIYSGSNAGAGTILAPLGTGVQVSDIIIARSSTDVTAKLASLASWQSRIRSSLVRKWTDVL